MWIFIGTLQLVDNSFTYKEIIMAAIFVGICTYYVCTIFLDLYNEIILALLLCVAIDKELNDGVPQFGPKEIHHKLESVYEYHRKAMFE